MHPVLFKLGPIEVYSYGVMLMLGFVAAILWARRDAARQGIKPEKVIDLSLWVLVCGLIFARLIFIYMNLDFYRSQPLSSLFLAGGRFAIQGLSFHGGLLGALIGGLIYARFTKISWLTLADISAPALALGYGFGRIGCFLNGCCLGAPTDLPWAVRFLSHKAGELWTAPSHPTQIYAALGSWAIFALLIWLRPGFPRRGQLFFAYIALYSVLRFLVEFLRLGYSASPAFDSITQAQIASAVLLVAALFIMFFFCPKETTGDSRRPRPYKKAKGG